MIEPVEVTHEELLAFARETFDRCLATMEAKGRDYSANDNVLDNFNFVSAFGIHPLMGLWTRACDKIKRFWNLISWIATGQEPRQAAVKDEPWQDTAMDLINYVVIITAYAKGYTDRKIDPSDIVVKLKPNSEFKGYIADLKAYPSNRRYTEEDSQDHG